MALLTTDSRFLCSAPEDKMLPSASSKFSNSRKIYAKLFKSLLFFPGKGKAVYVSNLRCFYIYYAVLYLRTDLMKKRKSNLNVIRAACDFTPKKGAVNCLSFFFFPSKPKPFISCKAFFFLPYLRCRSFNCVYIYFTFFLEKGGGGGGRTHTETIT